MITNINALVHTIYQLRSFLYKFILSAAAEAAAAMSKLEEAKTLE